MKAQTKFTYCCAMLQIVSSIALAFIQILTIQDVAGGTLMYIAQAFLLAGSIFGLDYYVYQIMKYAQGTNAGTQK